MVRNFFILFLMLSMNSTYAVSCKEALNLSKVAALLHIDLPLIDETRISKITQSFIDILDYEKIYLTQSEYDNIIIESKKKSFFIYESIMKNDCSYYQNILNQVNHGKNRFFNTFIKNLKDDPNEEYLFYNRKYPFVFFENEAKITEHIKTHAKNIIENRESILSEVINASKTKDTKQTEDYFLQSIIKSFDPHSAYFQKKESEDLLNSLQGLNYGIGINIEPANKKDGTGLLVESVNEESPATKYFLKNDIILSINDLKTEKGKFSEIKNYFKRFDVLKFVIKRKNKIIKLEDIRREKYINKEERVSSIVMKKNKKNIGVITVPSFYIDKENKSSVSYDFLLEYKELYQNKKIDLLIVDLRNNSGGSLEEAVRLSGLFIPNKKIVTVKSPQHTEDYNSPYTEEYIQKPTIVLINRNSASASEIFAGALKDYGKALIVGDDHTYGKGSAQTIYPDIHKNALFKITSQLFFSPAGSSIQHLGVSSDIIIPSKYQLINIGEKNNLFSISPSFMEKSTSMKKNISIKNSRKLQKKSNQRVIENKNFKKFINLESFLKWDAKSKNQEITSDSNDIILNESINIGLDYLDIKRNK